MRLSIYSSSKKVFEGEVNEISVPTPGGQISILPNHENLISLLELGEAKVTINGNVDNFVLNGGFITVGNDSVTILADEAHMSKELVRSEIEEAIRLAEEKRMSTTLPPSDLVRLERQVRYEKLKKKIVEM